MEIILNAVFGWLVDRVAADPASAVYLFAALASGRALLSFLDNYLDGRAHGWPQKILIVIVRVLNRWATAQGAARGLAGKFNKTSRTAKRDDGKPNFSWQ